MMRCWEQELRFISGRREGVTNQDQLLIGSLENVNVSDKSKNRHNFSEITVKIIEIDNPNRTTKVSIIGDSISTFKNYCDETKGGAYYPKSDCDVASVSDTWWHKLIYTKMSTGTFEKNISAGNTTVVQNTTGDSSSYWYGWDEEELNLYELVKLGPDSLVYRTMNKPREEMETFEYSRWKEPEKLDLHGLQLEDAADEFHL